MPNWQIPETKFKFVVITHWALGSVKGNHDILTCVVHDIRQVLWRSTLDEATSGYVHHISAEIYSLRHFGRGGGQRAWTGSGTCSRACILRVRWRISMAHCFSISLCNFTRRGDIELSKFQAVCWKCMHDAKNIFCSLVVVLCYMCFNTFITKKTNILQWSYWS